MKKTILVTGATAGIGRHAALELVRLGHHVIATGRREQALDELAKEARAILIDTDGGGKLDVLRLDVTDDAAVEASVAIVNELTAGHGVDVLVNNAGYGQMGPLESVTTADLRKQFETNVFGLMAMTRAFVPQMRKRGSGRVINVGSIGGRFTFPLMGAYNATKYAVESLSDALRCELAPFGIDVAIVEPGPIKTEFNAVAMDTIDADRVSTSPYARVLEQAEKVKSRFDSRAAGPEVTTKAIVHAATARRPKVRYVVPPMLAAALALLSILPTRLVDYGMRLAAGLTRKNLLPA
jgi:NAD(P)-dependent dehydrogenase (short-subunit alcohol dehydrogenase family)